ncbi:O-6-methylguanine-DNA methyltransferase, isoform CRA_b, partial [Rattus norvegicus]
MKSGFFSFKLSLELALQVREVFYQRLHLRNGFLSSQRRSIHCLSEGASIACLEEHPLSVRRSIHCLSGGASIV